jgi:predicted secreted protein
MDCLVRLRAPAKPGGFASYSARERRLRDSAGGTAEGLPSSPGGWKVFSYPLPIITIYSS